MTAAGPVALVGTAPHERRGVVAPVAIVAGLVAIVVGRAAAARAGFDPLGLGMAFAIALGFVAVAEHLVEPGRTPVRRRLQPDLGLVGARVHGLARPVAIGTVVGLGLVAVTMLAPVLSGTVLPPGLGRPAAPFAPWAAITILVAIAQEAVLRGALFRRLDRLAGPAAAVLVTAVVFALMHVPLYGWHVVPLDLAVGLALGGLRVATGGFAAPAAAHATADLATWWL